MRKFKVIIAIEDAPELGEDQVQTKITLDPLPSTEDLNNPTAAIAMLADIFEAMENGGDILSSHIKAKNRDTGEVVFESSDTLQSPA